MAVEHDYTNEELDPSMPAAKCRTATCDQTEDDGELIKCDGCDKRFCDACIAHVDGLDLCPQCVREA